MELNKEHYALLVGCALKEDFSAWSEFIANSSEQVALRGANLDGLCLNNISFVNKDGKGADLYGASFKNSELVAVNMSNSYLAEVDMTGAIIKRSNFQESLFNQATLRDCYCSFTFFDEANFQNSNLNNIEFHECSFYEATFYTADLSGAKFLGGGHNPVINREIRFNMCGMSIRNSKLSIDTYFHIAEVSNKTDFRTIDFEKARFSAGLKQTLQYCNRKHNWEDWYTKNNKSTSKFVSAFWAISDYGRSPLRVIQSFFSVCMIFAILYYSCGSLTNNNSMGMLNSIYFSVVTMTTLGFGDISANLDSNVGQILVMLQVVLGYVILGALISVLSNLFTSDGPPQGLVKHPKTSPIGFRVTIT
ncbi:pentapeptide repeat-containing protein [Vibrio parahaemolyticus]|nr:pentapeptide repeat-containing protein [Vibrio parahaemolyticus]